RTVTGVQTCALPISRMGDKHVIPEFILRVARRETPFAIYGGGETRAFCHVSDAVRATHLVATTAGCEQQIVHIGNSREEITIERSEEHTSELQSPYE